MSWCNISICASMIHNLRASLHNATWRRAMLMWLAGHAAVMKPYTRSTQQYLPSEGLLTLPSHEKMGNSPSFLCSSFSCEKIASVILSEPDRRTYYGYGMFKFPLHSLCCPFIIRNLLRAFREIIPIKNTTDGSARKEHSKGLNRSSDLSPV